MLSEKNGNTILFEFINTEKYSYKIFSVAIKFNLEV